MAYTPKNPNGQATMANSEPVVIASDQSTVPVSVSGVSTAANQTTIIGHVDGIETLIGTTNSTLTTIEGDTSAIQTSVQLLDDTVATDGAAAVTKLLQVGGTDGTNAQIISTNASGHVNIADGGNTITVDGSVGISGSVVVQDGGGSLTVDNNGTFVVQDSQTITDNTGFTDGTSKVFTAGFIYDEVAGTALTENDAAAARINVNRALVNAIEDGATRGRYATVTAANAVKVDGSAVTQPVSGTVSITANSAVNVAQMNGTTVTMGNGASGTGVQRVTLASDSTGNIATIGTSVTPGTAAANLGKARDAIAGANDTGIAHYYVRRDTPTAVTPAAGDYEIAQISANGEQWVRLAGELADDSAFTVGTTRVVPAGLLADETSPDSVDEGDIGIPRMTLDRKAISTLYPSSTTGDGLLVANFNTGDTFTALTNSAQVIKATAGNFYGYYIYNPNATATYVMLYNVAAASVTVGTTTPAMVFCIPATSGANLSLAYPIPFTNAGWSIAAATTGGGNTAPATALEAMIFYK